MNMNRNPGGTPTGGQFAATVHAESDVALGAGPPTSTPESADRWASEATNVASWGTFEDVPGIEVDDLTELRTGDVVAVLVDGKFHQGMVSDVQAGHVVARYATDRDLADADKAVRARKSRHLNRVPFADKAAAVAGEEWDSAFGLTDRTNPVYDPSTTDMWTEEDVEGSVAAAEDLIGEWGTREDHVESVRQERLDSIDVDYTEAIETGPTSQVVTQDAVVQAGEAKLLRARI